MRKWFSDLPMAAQLSTAAVIGVVIFSAALTILTSYLIARQLQASAIADATLQTEQFAERSAFAMLVGDSEIGDEAARAMTRYPAVKEAFLLRPSRAPFVGEASALALAATRVEARHMPIVTDEADTWVVSAPVLSEGAPEALSDSAGPSQFLGTAVLVVSKAPYRQTIRTIIVINAAAALAATALLIGLLTLQIRRITGPLRALSEAMRRDARLPAEVALVGGSREMRNIASVYNEMVGAVSGAQAALQTQVEIRTEELKAARDQALAAKQQQSEIMAAVTHEMKTPLQGIKGYAELSLEQLVFVQEEESARRIREAQGNILEGAEELRTRIGQVLDLAQAEGGKHEVKIERLLLPTLLHAIADTIRPLAATNGNTLHLEFDDTQFVETDGGKLRQIAINLLTNACKFTEDGEIRFISRSGGETLVLEVADTGIGIDPKNHDLIFERFRQVDMSSTRNYGGTGLGLAVAKEFAKLLGGTISVRSALGTGAAFTVSVPSFLA